MTPDRQPPFAPEAEISVLGGMLIDPDAASAALEMLDATVFYRESNRRVFRAMASLFERGATIDPVTVSEQLKQTGELESVGGMAYLAELLDAVPTAANIRHHAQIVLDRATLRRTIEAASQAIRDCYEPGERTAGEIVDAAQQRLASVADSTVGDGLVWVKDALWGVFEGLEQRSKSPGGLVGIPTGFPDLDRKTGGLRRKQYVILAARPSMGKTGLAVQIMLTAACDHGIPVAFFSAEMSRDEIIARMLCTEALADLSNFGRGCLTDDEYTRLVTASGRINAAPLYVDDHSTPTVMEIRAKTRRAIAEHPDLALVVVDHIGFVKAEGENRQNEVANASKGLKALAKDLNVCVLALSQLSREPTKRADARPQLSDLRDSGSLEQDADMVLMLHRPDYYVTAHEAEKQGIAGAAELAIRKQRNGPTGEIDLRFNAPCACFESTTQQEYTGPQLHPPKHERAYRDITEEREA